MPVTLARIRGRVRSKIRDLDEEHGSFTSVEIDMAIADAYIAAQAQLPAPEVYTASGLTLTGGTPFFTLSTTVGQYTGGSGGAEYRGNIRIQLAATGIFLNPVDESVIDGFINSQAIPIATLPFCFSLKEDKSQVIQGRCYPQPISSLVCNLWVSMAADDLRDYVGSGTGDMDSVSVLMSRMAAQALVFSVSAELLAQMTPEDLALRKINPNVIPLWIKRADELMLQDAGRQHDLQAVDTTPRWTRML